LFSPSMFFGEYCVYPFQEYTVAFPGNWEALSELMVYKLCKMREPRLRVWVGEKNGKSAVGGVLLLPVAKSFNLSLSESYREAACIQAIGEMALQSYAIDSFVIQKRGHVEMDGVSTPYFIADLHGAQVEKQKLLVFACLRKYRHYCVGFYCDQRDFKEFKKTFLEVAKTFRVS